MLHIEFQYPIFKTTKLWRKNQFIDIETVAVLTSVANINWVKKKIKIKLKMTSQTYVLTMYLYTPRNDNFIFTFIALYNIYDDAIADR